MNIEDLSKAQLLLLTVMVNFVVSIATGVLTVSLLDQAPITVSQGVNRIVDHTIQTISTPIQVANPIKAITSGASQPSTPTPEQMLTAAVSDDIARTVLIHRSSTTTPALAFGVYLPKSRAVVTSAVEGLPTQAVIEFSDGSAAPVSLAKSNTELAIYGFSDEEQLPKVPDAVLPSSSKLKQGQTVVALTKDSSAITGIISKVDAGSIQTSLSGLPVGAAVVDLFGEVIGIGNGAGGLLIPADAITALLQSTK